MKRLGEPSTYNGLAAVVAAAYALEAPDWVRGSIAVLGCVGILLREGGGGDSSPPP